MDSYLISSRKQFLYYKQLGERTMAQLNEQELLQSLSYNDNSIAHIVKHLSGNV
ncbi:MAG: hypothetical protein CMO34_05470 [Verrucomicrobia bacterium]|nr:hypothetical protein [Verrucomicrobiota bacterium]